MALSKFKSLKKYQAVKKFTDREQPLEVFYKLFNQVKNQDEFFKVLVYYGIGGIGKSTLLKKIKNIINDDIENNPNQFQLISIDMDAHEFDSPIDTLISIRNKFQFQADIFDYALSKYFYLKEDSTEHLISKMPDQSICLQIINLFEKFKGESVSNQLWKKTIKELHNKNWQRFENILDELNLVDNFDLAEIEERLPYYLGIGLSAEFEKAEITYIFILDAYEFFLLKTKNTFSKEIPDSWFREFIASTERGLFVIGSREFLKWADYNDEWDQILDQHILGKLSDNDADYFLKHVPIESPEIRKAITVSSNGLPLYLDLCVNIYIQNYDKNKVIDPSLFDIPRDEIVKRFLSHLNKEEQEIMQIISQLPFFDYNLYKSILENFKISNASSIFNDFINLSFVLKIDEKHSLYKIHDYVREQICFNFALEIKNEISNFFIKYLSVNKFNMLFEIIKKYFGAFLSFQSIEYNYRKEDIEYFIDLSLFLIDNGYWKEVGIATEKILNNDAINNRFRTALTFLKCEYLRRTGDVVNSLKLIDSLDISENNLGKFHVLAEFSKANYIRLSGNYDNAQPIYENLSETVTYDSHPLFYTKINRQYADLIFLRGRFKKSIELIKNISDKPSNSIEKAENFRISGHIYRFNHLFNKADNIYNECLRIAEDSDSIGLIGKLYTNLTETFCWIDSKKAIKYSEKSIEINKQLDSLIELGKTYAALSIAYLNCDDIESSLKFAEKSKKIQIQSSYQSGILFAEYAKFFIFLKTQDRNSIARQIKIVSYLITDLNVYNFFKLPIYLYKCDIKNLDAIKNSIEWLDFENSISFYIDCFRSWGRVNKWRGIVNKLCYNTDNFDSIEIKTILFLSADPSDVSRLRLGEEFREIHEKLKIAKQRESFNLELPHLSIRPADISQALLDTKPHIVHFSGHGTSSGALCFENQISGTHLVQPDALAALFEQFKGEIYCVLLNACYSYNQAKAIVNHVDYVIGMNNQIGDRAAIAFSIGFYQALGAGRTVEDSYKFGVVQIRLCGIPEHLTPVLLKKDTELET